MKNTQQFSQVDPNAYADRLIGDGVKPFQARKKGAVFARKAVPGETVEVYTEDGLLEAVETASEGMMVLMRAAENGSIYLNPSGLANKWLVSREVFESKYDTENIRMDGFVRPRGGLQTFIQCDRNISLLVPWGENGALIEQKVLCGGYLNITDRTDIYGIAAEEFEATYRRTDS